MELDISGILNGFSPGKREGLLPILQAVQKSQGVLTEEALGQVAGYLMIPVNKVYGVAAFYDEFRFKPKGTIHVEICRGTTCHLNGKPSLLKELEKQLRVSAGQTRRDKKVSLEVVRCLGACHQSPVLRVNEVVHSCRNAEELGKIIQEIKEQTE